ncbi:Peptidase M20 domain-containing protein 2 [Nymphon striatum]|nr:Peptidase M20 domain-containing protein 2 [Nymphon striatum]
MTEKEIYEGMRVAILKEKSKLKEVSQNIWEHPELAFEEVFAHDLLCDALENYGFTVSRSYKLSTAFKAEFKIDSETTQKGRTVAIICEYDALPELGHGCGHNLIAECGLGAALGVKAIMESRMSGVVGTLVVMGTPAEEKGKGKVKLIEAGAFNGIDMALMAHPGPGNLAHPLTYLALTEFDVKFVGRAAHAANYPWGGINALDGVVLCYSNITALRQQMKPSWRVHMNITNGGAALNVIPEIAEMQIMVRALTFSELEILKKDIINCIHGAATASKCEVSITEGVSMKNVMSNYELAKTYRKYSEMSGEKFLDDDPHQTIVTSGSTDMGNVTHIMPGIHPKFFIGKQVGCHTKQFAEAAKSSDAQIHVINTAVSIGCTVVEALSTKFDLFDRSQKEFSESRGSLGKEKWIGIQCLVVGSLRTQSELIGERDKDWNPLFVGGWMDRAEAKRVNGFYKQSENIFALYAGVLQDVMYMKNRPHAMNLGGAGFVIGHEISHGFDNRGSTYAADGTYTNWWSNSTKLEYDKKVQCFKTEYGKYDYPHVENKKLNTNISIGEIMGDFTGIESSYHFLNEYLKAKGSDEKKHDSFGYTDRQLFWIAVGQVNY